MELDGSSLERVPTLTSAEATRAGIGRWQLAGRSYARVRRGLYVPVGTPCDDLDGRTAITVRMLPEGFVLGGWAAARVHEQAHRSQSDELEVFDGRLPEMDSDARVALPILVCASRPGRLRPQPGVRVFRSDLEPHEVAVVGGLPVTAPTRTAFDVARLWPLEAAVVALDRLRALGLVAADDVAAMLAERTGWRGVGVARRALDLSQDGVESPRESMMRLLWHRAGLPRPVCNGVVLDEHGSFAGRVDLLDIASGLVAEYDGSFHASAARRHADARRQELLEHLGLTVVRANDPDIATAAGRRAWQARVRRAYDRARADRRPGRWTLGTTP
ncbi:DUF559 domain-containing protein [Actinotalea fermentans]|uniref:DUF559 domain-containing protein n=1 Tax=Actinotalea fermentans TaxID=43671 RepID=A0A511YZE2_9CELL|nr:DUF559 domain-containing protein [Actinotalea fermentans]KGM15617.1 hypothetical protein N867_07010 [Actinotalea fermentans ATCC 43279 = JCM 9966 = DSM 3133]GEN80565.1 hypothetical protein AFE02nite_22990 [Actinotalea fermentans]